jgi:hypothetical protein
VTVPLSEEEQRILHEMEQKLAADDPKFAGRGPSFLSVRDVAQAAKWPTLFFIAGFVTLVLSFRTSLILATAGFVVMLLAALYFERRLRQLDGSPIRGVPRSISGRTLGEDLSDLQRRIRSHFKHDR